MKTLLIDARYGGDWSLDLLFAGLVRRFGPSHVIDFPAHYKHREPLIYTGDSEKDWGLERRTLGYTSENNLVQSPSENEIFEFLQRGEIDRIFLDERDESYEMYIKLRAHFFNVPVVVVAGHDRFWNNSPQKIVDRFGPQLEAMFIDNWRPEYSCIRNAHIYNWSINFDHYWDPSKRSELLKNKVYDISFMGYNSHQDRAMIADHILSKWGHLKNNIMLERQPNTMRSFVQKKDYFETIAQSKICLNLRGAAENGKTLRFYEIPYVGSCMLTQDTDAAQVYPFQHGTHCAYFKTLDQLDGYIDILVSDENRREFIAMSGHDWAMTRHTVDARINQMYTVLRG